MNGADGSRTFLISYPALTSARERGLHYQVEGSSTLTPDSWVPLPTTLERLLSSPDPEWTRCRHRVAFPDGQAPRDAYFLRVRVTAD